MVGMPGADSAGRAVGTTIKGARAAARGGRRTAGWIGRRVGTFRRLGGAGEAGMMRLLDLHAASCAGDTLITIGLAGTIFFNADVGQARGRVALYLIITMVPFALLAPVVGPLLDRFRHGRRYALAVTMLGRAFLAWLISDYIHGFGLFPAAFGVLALSRAYGVARSAAVPRLLPPGLGLSEAGARASIFGTVAGAVAAPIGLLAIQIGPQWPLRVASIVFIIGAVVAMRLPARADSDPPEVLPRIFQMPSRRTVKVLEGRLITEALIGCAALRGLYGFLTLFLAFAIKSGTVSTKFLGVTLHQTTALALAVGALGAGSFIATAVGARMSIKRPLWLQAVGIVAVAVAALAALIFYSLTFVVILCLVTAIASGLAKLAVDASIQERIPENVRASAFAHSETLLMLAWVIGGAIGLIPFSGRIGVIVCTIGIAVSAARAVLVALQLRKERLSGISNDSTVSMSGPGTPAPVTTPVTGPTAPAPTAATTRQLGPAAPTTARLRSFRTLQEPLPGTTPQTTKTKGSRWGRRKKTGDTADQLPETKVEPVRTDVLPRGQDDQPSYHLYRPSTLDDGE
jgi:MFS family permease